MLQGAACFTHTALTYGGGSVSAEGLLGGEAFEVYEAAVAFNCVNSL